MARAGGVVWNLEEEKGFEQRTWGGMIEGCGCQRWGIAPFIMKKKARSQECQQLGILHLTPFDMTRHHPSFFRFTIQMFMISLYILHFNYFFFWCVYLLHLQFPIHKIETANIQELDVYHWPQPQTIKRYTISDLFRN